MKTLKLDQIIHTLVAPFTEATMISEYAIEVRGFTKRFGDFTAVDNISFSVERGSIFAFLGPNGAGKSTTINTLCTIQEKTLGDLLIHGHDVSREQDLVRKDIGIVFQESTLDHKLTVEENLKLHCDFYAVPPKEVRERIQFVLELVDLLPQRNHPVGSLSGGMKRRAEIARGLVHFPKVLFLDEPTTGLDPQTRANVWEYIQRLQKDKEITIFLTTHYMEEAEICSQVAIIDHGKIVAHDTPANLKRDYTQTTVHVGTDNFGPVREHLSQAGIVYTETPAGFSFKARRVSEVLALVSEFKDSIQDLEILKGTLNDVFLAITGKEIRV